MGLIEGAFEEKLGLETLAHQAALHVDLRGEDGVDLARGDGGPQFVDCQHSTHRSPALSNHPAVIETAVMPRLDRGIQSRNV